jgi:hypothetical protein
LNILVNSAQCRIYQIAGFVNIILAEGEVEKEEWFLFSGFSEFVAGLVAGAPSPGK